MKVYKLVTLKGTYYDISGAKTDTNLYGKKGEFVKELMTNCNGRKFSPHIEEAKLAGQAKECEIKFSELPKYLQKSFEEYKTWLLTTNK